MKETNSRRQNWTGKTHKLKLFSNDINGTFTAFGKMSKQTNSPVDLVFLTHFIPERRKINGNVK